MSEFGDLIPEFVEESLEHLKNIEEDIIVIEQGSADKELINRVFRAVHSIKGGSSFLGLKNIELLSHKMEDIFNLVRNDELNFTSEISSSVLKSIDTLKDMLEESEESDGFNIDENLKELKRCLDMKPVDKVAERMQEDIEDTTIKLDRKRFDALRKQGKKVYLIQFELKEDETEDGKNLMDFFNEIEKTGEILVRNVDMELVLKDDSFTGEGIPLSILYASVLEKDLVAHIFGIGEESVKEVVPDSMVEDELISDAQTMNTYADDDDSTSGASYFDSRSDDSGPAQSKGSGTSSTEDSDEMENEYYPVREAADYEDSDTDSPEIQKIPEIKAEQAENVIDEFDEDEEDLDIDVVKDNNEYLTFWVGEEEYGIGISQVHEIVTLHDITPLPGAEEYTKGVINLRGDILPVYDFRIRLQFDEREYDDKTIILIVMINEKKVGVVVDRVSEVIQLKREEVTDAPQMQDIPSQFVIGIGQKEEKFIILLKLKEIFGSVGVAA
jgi:chemotaxis signal transduction protein/HPt (histidine-containing phosphotransfer) domain-containing protein